jgi:hypothetical protein
LFSQSPVSLDGLNFKLERKTARLHLVH